MKLVPVDRCLKDYSVFHVVKLICAREKRFKTNQMPKGGRGGRIKITTVRGSQK